MKTLQSKQLIFSFIAFFITATSWSQTTYTWTGVNNASWIIATNWVPLRTIPAANDILQFNDGTSKAITSVPSQTIGKLLVSSNTSIVLNTASAGRTLTIGNATGTDLVIGSGSSMTIGVTAASFTITLAANATADISGTFIIGNSQVYTTNSASNVTTVAGTGIIQNKGTVNSSTTTQLSFLSGATYTHALNGGTIPVASWNANANTAITGITSSVPSGLNQSFGDFIWNCSGQTSSINFAGNLTTINGDFIVANTGTGRILMGSNNTITLNVGGSITIGSAGNTAILDMDASNGVITINFPGDLITLGSGQIDNTGANNATFNFNSASGTQNINLGNSSSFVVNWGGNMNIGTGSGTNTVVLQTNLALASAFHTNITVKSGSAFDMGSFVISNKGTFTTSSGSILKSGHAAGISPTASATGNIQVTGTKTYSTGTDYTFNGSVTQVTGMGLPATVNRLTIDNSAGVNTGAGVSLSQATAITTELILTNGYLQTTSANMLTVNSGGIVTATTNAFIAGPMRKIGSTNFTFPTGWAGLNGGRIPISVSSLSASATIQAEYKRTSATTVGTTITAPLNHVSFCEYWELFPTAGSVNATITMSWNIHNNCALVSYINDFTTLRVARSNGSAWTNAGNTGTTGTLASGTVISNAATTINNTTPFKYFSLASTSVTTNPLPVLFGDVKAYEINNGVQVEWSNLTEKDLVNYVVERSANGQSYTAISQQLPRSNQNDKESYSSFDASPFSGTNFYRIKVLELSGKIIYSKIVRVDIGKTQDGFALYPNPVKGNQVTVGINANQGLYTVKVLNTAGQEIYSQRIVHQGGFMSQTVALPYTVKPGVYTMLISGENYREAKMFVVVQ